MRRFRGLLVAATLALLLVASVQAHPGRTDSNGGHTCRTNCPSWGLSYGQYHHHGGSSSSGGYSSGYTTTTSSPEPKNIAPVASATYVFTSRYTATLTASKSHDEDGSIASYTWSLPSGPAPGMVQEVRFPANGAYDLDLAVVDDDGGQGHAGLRLTIGPPFAYYNHAPVAVPRVTVNGTLLGLNGTESLDPDGDALSFTWLLDGEPIAEGPTTVVDVPGGGLHNVSLRLADAYGRSDEVSVPAYVRPLGAPRAEFAALVVNGNVTLNASSSWSPNGSVRHEWRIGDTNVTGPVLNLTTDTPRDVTLTVYDDAGRADVLAIRVKAVEVEPTPPMTPTELNQTAQAPAAISFPLLGLLGVLSWAAHRRQG